MRRIVTHLLLLIISSGAAMSQDKPTINVTSHNQQGGITAYKVVIGRIDLTFSTEVAAKIEERLPKDRPFDLMAIGGSRDLEVVEAYANYLQQHGYTLRSRSRAGIVSPPPDAPITIIVAPDHSVLQIAPRA